MAFNAATVNERGNAALSLGGQYAEILDFLCAPLTGPANVKVLVSEAGLGKTLLLRAAIERMKPEARTAYVFWTLFKPEEFISYLLFEMGAGKRRAEDLDAAQKQFEKLLRHAAAEGKRFVLAIDEAHNLSPATLNHLSALLDRDTANPPQTTILLAGLPKLRDRLADPKASPLQKRIAGVMSIAPLNAEQTTEYIRARINALGIGPVSAEGVASIATSSGGVLRQIDKLCHELVLEHQSLMRRADDTCVADGAGDESSIMRVAEFAMDRHATWSGTPAELAAATGIPVEELSELIENRCEELRQTGVEAGVQRAPGKPRMITLRPIQPERWPEPSDGVIPEVREDEANVQPALGSEELETGAGFTAGPVDKQPENLEQLPQKRRAKMRAAIAVLSLLAVLAGTVFYFSYGKLPYQARSAPQRAVQLKRSTEEMDEVAKLRRSAQAGNANSQTALADRYREGNGVPRDSKAAMVLYQQAATRGDPAAQKQLALALSSGSDGITRDPVTAYAWLVMARSRGEEIDGATLDSLTRSLSPSEIGDVRYRLGRMYEDGIGCDPDFVLADEWFLLAADAGDIRSGAESAALERRMTRQQIAQAHARSDDWLRRHSNTAYRAAAR